MTRPYDYTSDRDVMALFQSQKGLCAVKGCGVKLKLERPRNFVIEHRIALALGGSNDIENKELRCKRCADAKTFHPRGPHTTIDSDIHSIRKTKRLEARRLGTAKPKRKKQIPTRGFQKKPVGYEHKWGRRKVGG